VISLSLSPQDVLATRFAFSPLWEAVLSYRAARCPEALKLRGRWLDEAVAIGRETDSVLLDVALGLCAGAGRHVCDFLLPAPGSCFAEELARVRAGDPATVAADVRAIYGERLPDGAERYLEHPEQAMAAAADVVERYWEAVVRPRWPRVHAVLEGDVAFRGREIARRGAGALFDDLHPAIRWQDGTLAVDRPHELQVEGGGRGVVLVPLVFSWPTVLVSLHTPAGPMLAYTPRGVESFWLGERPEGDEVLASLVGHARDALLRSLPRPRTTTELAQTLGVTPSAVSQRLGDLRRLGLVDAQRLGRRVYYRRSARAERLLELFAEPRRAPDVVVAGA
jgi:DNA-binding transcriptional ArsR family regulator